MPATNPPATTTPAPTAARTPVQSLLAPDPEVARHPAVLATATIAEDVLAPHATAADDPARGVDPAHLALLAGQGLLSVTMPVAEGGYGADSAVVAETVELLSGACGATWFLSAQHWFPQLLSRGPLPGLPAEAVELGPAAARHRAGLADASTSAGIVTAHLRRPGPPAVRAEPAPSGGWTLHGGADWCTGWGLLDVVMIAASAPADRIVFTMVPARERPGLRTGAALPLVVMGGTRTVGLELDGMAVAAEEVLSTVDAAAWRANDAARTVNTTPACLGLLRRVLVELYDLGVRRDRPEAVDTALTLVERAATWRSEAYELLFAVPATERLDARASLRGEIGALTVRAANALVAARSGSALLSTSPEQRWLREATFHLVQAQTTGVRVAQLAAFVHRGARATAP